MFPAIFVLAGFRLAMLRGASFLLVNQDVAVIMFLYTSLARRRSPKASLPPFLVSTFLTLNSTEDIPTFKKGSEHPQNKRLEPPKSLEATLDCLMSVSDNGRWHWQSELVLVCCRSRAIS